MSEISKDFLEGYKKAIDFCKGLAEKEYHRGYADGMRESRPIKSNKVIVGDVITFKGTEYVITCIPYVGELMSCMRLDCGDFIFLKKDCNDFERTNRHICLSFLANYRDEGYQE